MEEFLVHVVGISPTDLFAGFTGGLMAALVVSGARPQPWSIFCSVVVGASCGGYLGPLVPAWMPVWLGLKAGPGVSFGTGVAGMPLCRTIIFLAQNAQNIKFGNDRDKGSAQ